MSLWGLSIPLASHQWNDSAPDCIKHGVSPDEGVAAPYEDCAGFFTWGPGRDWVEGKVVESGALSLYVLTTVGFVVSLIAFVAWVWFEHRKLTAQAERLRAAGPLAAPSPPPGRTFE